RVLFRSLEERDQRLAFRLAGHPLQWHLGPWNDVFGSIGEQVGDGFLRPYDVGILEGIRIGIAGQRTGPAAKQIVECRACPVGPVRRQRMADGTLAGELPLTKAQVAADLEPAREVALASVERRRAIKGQMNDVVVEAAVIEGMAVARERKRPDRPVRVLATERLAPVLGGPHGNTAVGAAGRGKGILRRYGDREN